MGDGAQLGLPDFVANFYLFDLIIFKSSKMTCKQHGHFVFVFDFLFSSDKKYVLGLRLGNDMK